MENGRPKFKRWGGISLLSSIIAVRSATLKSIALIVAVGAIIYVPSLSNQFVGDDFGQIVNNPSVQSFGRVTSLFASGTFGSSGPYYRPLMMVAFSAIYALFGSVSFYFHLFQLIVCICNAVLVFLILRHFIRPTVALAGSLIFLVHPVNSQVVYSIAALQDALYFVFGMLAFWTLVRFQGRPRKYLVPTSALLALSLLSKETGILFFVVSILYLVITDWRRSLPLAYFTAAAVPVYVLVRIHAVGAALNPHNSPIDNLSFWARMLNVPAILFFYIWKIFLPARLAHYYDWSYQTFTIQHFLLPLCIDLGFVVLVGWAWLKIKRRGQIRESVLFQFFCAWFVLGLIIHIQFVPLDLTVSETWLYFSMVGLLGMVGVVMDVFRVRESLWLAVVFALILGVFGLRSALRGGDWNNTYKLAFSDVAVSPQDYDSDTDISYYLSHEGKFAQALSRANDSIGIYPSFNGYDARGLADIGLHRYADALSAFSSGLRIKPGNKTLVDHMGELTLWYGDSSSNRQLLERSTALYPRDPYLWFYLAIVDYNGGDYAGARVAITHSAGLSGIYSSVYEPIMDNKKFTIHVDDRPPLTFSG